MNLDEKMIQAIRDLVDSIKKENGIINEIIRDDVFSILQDCNCTVLYYPLEGEEKDGCDGCHLEKPVNGKMEQFVFINTNNTRERQAFSAAHELGHIWRVDDRVRKMFPGMLINTEDVVNKFAAELLMPEKHFQGAIEAQLKKMEYKGPTMDMTTMVRLIAYLMNYFFVPYKSVVIRFNELGRLDKKYDDQVFMYKDSDLLHEIIKAEQYTRLGIVNKLKSMDNLQENLIKAEQLGVISELKVNNIKEDFNIQSVVENNSSKVEF